MTRSNGGAGRHRPLKVDPAHAVYLWHQGRTVTEIADHFDVTHGAVTYHLRQAGVMDDPKPQPGYASDPVGPRVIERTGWPRPHEGPWHERAACLGVDRDRKDRFHSYNPAIARTYCRACPVTLDCLLTALNAEAQSYRFGVWGGLTSKQRARLTPDSDLPAAIADALAPGATE